MKRLKTLAALMLLMCLFVALFIGVTHAADFSIPTQSMRTTAPVGQDLAITNANNTVGIKAMKKWGTTSNFVELHLNGTPVYTIGTNGVPTIAGLTASLPVFTDASKGLASKSIANSKLALGIQSGTVTTAANGTVTNTFGTAFSSTPIVICTPVNNATPTNTVRSTSTTQFIYDCGDSSVTVNWIAIGAP